MATRSSGRDGRDGRDATRRQLLRAGASVVTSVLGTPGALAQSKATPLPPGVPVALAPGASKQTASSPPPPPPRPLPQQPTHGHDTGAVPRRPLGKTGADVAVLGVGGHHLGDAKSYGECADIVARALDAGLDFFDNCWEYHNGKCEEWLGRALKGRRHQAFVMTKVCTHGRAGALGLQMLEQSLRRLGTDHVDLWQIHAISFDNDPALAYARGGILEALDAAKRAGKTRFVGFTGHKDPAFHLEMIRRGFPFDTVQMPVNAMDWHFFSFEKQVLPEAQKRGIAVLGMKPLGGTADVVRAGVLTAEECLRYAMSAPGVATTICGMESLAALDANLKIARQFTPLSDAERQAIRDQCARFAGDGRFELYKVSLKFDNPQTRHPHGFPIDAQQKEVQDELQSGEPVPGPDEAVPLGKETP